MGELNSTERECDGLHGELGHTRQIDRKDLTTLKMDPCH